MLDLWLDQPIWLMFVLPSVVFGFGTLFFCLASNWHVTRPALLRIGTGLVPAYFTAVSILLALLISAVANDAWERQRQASRVVQSERTESLAVLDLSMAAASDLARIRTALADYLDAVIEDEWPRMSEGASSPRASLAIGTLLRTVADPKLAGAVGAATQATLLSTTMALRAARGERLSLVQSHGDEVKWLTLLILACLTFTAIGLVHLERPWGQTAALLLFSIAMVTTLGLIALYERPFDGPQAMGVEPLRSARAAIPVP